MTGNEIRYILSQFVENDFSPEEFSTMIDHAQRIRFGVALRDKDWFVLRPFKVVMGDNNVPLMVTGGYAPIPADYSTYMDNTMSVVYDGVWHRIEIVEDGEWERRKTHSIEYPTLEYPIANFQSDNIRFLPKTIQYVTFEYIKNPETFVFGTTEVHGYQEYDPAGSTELAWNDPEVIDIIQIALQGLGVTATKEQIERKRDDA